MLYIHTRQKSSWWVLYDIPGVQYSFTTRLGWLHFVTWACLLLYFNGFYSFLLSWRFGNNPYHKGHINEVITKMTTFKPNIILLSRRSVQRWIKYVIYANSKPEQHHLYSNSRASMLIYFFARVDYLSKIIRHSVEYVGWSES